MKSRDHGRHVAGIDEIPRWPARAEERYAGQILFAGLDELADHRRHDVRCFPVEIVVFAVHIARHQHDGIEPVLLAIGSGEQEEHEFGRGIRCALRLGIALPELVLADGRTGRGRIAAPAHEADQLPHCRAAGCFEDEHRAQQVLVAEIGRVGAVGEDAADLGRQVHEDRRPLLGKHPGDGPLVEQIIILAADGQEGRLGKGLCSVGTMWEPRKPASPVTRIRSSGVIFMVEQVYQDWELRLCVFSPGHEARRGFFRENRVRIQQAKHFKIMTDPARTTAKVLLCIDSPSERLA